MKGFFKNGSVDGPCQIVYPNLDYFKGYTQEGVISDKGLVFSFCDNKWTFCEFANGAIQKEIKAGRTSHSHQSNYSVFGR